MHAQLTYRYMCNVQLNGDQFNSNLKQRNKKLAIKAYQASSRNQPNRPNEK